MVRSPRSVVPGRDGEWGSRGGPEAHAHRCDHPCSRAGGGRRPAVPPAPPALFSGCGVPLGQELELQGLALPGDLAVNQPLPRVSEIHAGGGAGGEMTMERRVGRTPTSVCKDGGRDDAPKDRSTPQVSVSWEGSRVTTRDCGLLASPQGRGSRESKPVHRGASAVRNCASAGHPDVKVAAAPCDPWCKWQRSEGQESRWKTEGAGLLRGRGLQRGVWRITRLVPGTRKRTCCWSDPGEVFKLLIVGLMTVSGNMLGPSFLLLPPFARSDPGTWLES